MVTGHAGRAESKELEAVAGLIAAWLSHPLLGRGDNFMPSNCHPLLAGQPDCLTGSEEYLPDNPLSTWIRTPLIRQSLPDNLEATPDRGFSIMDEYLLTQLDDEAFEMLEHFLPEQHKWCVHFSNGKAYVGTLAGILSLGLSNEMVRFFFRDAHSPRCNHKLLLPSGQDFIMWDPRIFIPTRSGLNIRQAIIAGKTQLCGPHPLLRATAKFLPEVFPIGTAVDKNIEQTFKEPHGNSLISVSVGLASVQQCRIPRRSKILYILGAVVFSLLAISRPLMPLFPKKWRVSVQEFLVRSVIKGRGNLSNEEIVSYELGFKLHLIR